jgi:hypothetical protein
VTDPEDMTVPALAALHGELHRTDETIARLEGYLTRAGDGPGADTLRDRLAWEHGHRGHLVAILDESERAAQVLDDLERGEPNP